MKLKAIKKPILEFIPVFLGVILALFFNNLNESRIDRKKIDGLLDKIALGTEKNIQNLDIQLEQNRKVLDSMMFYRDDPDMRISDILNRSRGIRYIQFDLAAWSVLKNSELLVDVDYDLVSLLYLLNESIIYDSQTISTPDNATDTDAKDELISTLGDYIGSIEHRKVLSIEIQKLLKKME